MRNTFIIVLINLCYC